MFYVIVRVSFQTCYEWFTKGILDLDTETQSKLFQNELLRTDPTKITEMGKFLYSESYTSGDIK